MNSGLLRPLGAIALGQALWIPAGAQEPVLVNLSVRAEVAADTPFISTFTLTPGPAKTILLRAVGPSLASFGLSGALADPKLELRDSEGVKVAENDNFEAGDAAAAAATGAFPLLPGGKDAVLITTLPAGRYDVRVTGVGGTAGTALVELYDLSGGDSRLTLFAANAQLGDASGENEGVLISGFTVSGNSGTRRMLFRAVGGAVAGSGPAVVGIKLNPSIEIFSGTKKIAGNDNWSAPTTADASDVHALSAAFVRSGAAPLDPAGWDAALVLDLAPGHYTVLTRAQRYQAGAVTVEAYEVPVDPNPGAPSPAAALELEVFNVSLDADGYYTQYYPSLAVRGQTDTTIVFFALRPEGVLWRGPPPTWRLTLPVSAGQLTWLIRSPSPPNTYYARDGTSFETGLEPATSVTAIVKYRLSDGSEHTLVGSARLR